MAVSEPLYGKNPAELAALCAETGLPRFAARQLARWLYVKHIEDPMLMTDIPAARRALLAERFRQVLTPPERVTESADGTKKYLFRTQQGAYIESAYIPDGDRATLCVSSQAGCRMGCKFCATGRQGLQHSLTAAEILNQIVSLPERDTLTNVVFMGMGEPLDNTDNVLRALDILTAEWGFGWSPTRITLSTAGVVPELRRLLDSFPDSTLIFTYPNNDPEGESIIRLIDSYVAARKGRAVAVASLGWKRYLSALHYVGAVVGNSSSGIVEVPSMGIPTVDIGIRQRGRLCAPSVIHCATATSSIASAIARALSPEFREAAAAVVNPYGGPDTLRAMTDAILSADPKALRTKRFHDLNTDNI